MEVVPAPTIPALSLVGVAAQNRDHLTYLCSTTDDLIYNKANGRWTSTSFIPIKKFVLKMDYKGTAPVDDFNAAASVYKVKVFGYEDKYFNSCTSLRGADTIEVIDGGSLICYSTILKQLHFNPATLRFVRYYEANNSKNHNDNTPAISTGTCIELP